MEGNEETPLVFGTAELASVLPLEHGRLPESLSDAGELPCMSWDKDIGGVSTSSSLSSCT